MCAEVLSRVRVHMNVSANALSEGVNVACARDSVKPGLAYGDSGH